MTDNKNMTADRRTLDASRQEETYNRDAGAFRDQSEQLPTWIYIGGPQIDKFAKTLKKGARVWDQGSASGRVVRRLIANGIEPQNITGVEISPDQVEIAKADIPEATFIVGNLATVKLEPNSMDGATQHMVGEHLDKDTLDAVNRNTFETLKPGGQYFVVLTHPSKTAISSGLSESESGTFTTTFPWGGEGLNFHRGKAEILKAYEDAGFVVDLVEDVSMPEESKTTQPEDYEKYKRYPSVRLVVSMHKPE